MPNKKKKGDIHNSEYKSTARNCRALIKDSNKQQKNHQNIFLDALG